MGGAGFLGCRRPPLQEIKINRRPPLQEIKINRRPPLQELKIKRGPPLQEIKFNHVETIYPCLSGKIIF